MFKLEILSVLFFPILLLGEVQEYRIEIKPEYPEVKIEGDSVEIICSGGYHYALPGEPDLPVVIYKVALPQNTAIKSFHYHITREILPVAYPVKKSRGIKEIGKSNRNPSSFIDDQCQLINDGYLAGFHIVTIALMPVVEEDGKLWFNSKVKLMFNLEGSPSSPSVPGSQLLFRKERGWLRGLVVNPQILDNYTYHPQGEYLHSNSIISQYSGSPPNGLIITPIEFKSILQPYIALRKKQGTFYALFTTDQIVSITNDSDLPRAIRTVIRAFYTNFALQSVLIFGNNRLVPQKRLNPLSPAGSYVPIESDYYYSALDGNLDSDQDGLLFNSSSDDAYPEVAVGRIEVQDTTQLKGVLEKLTRASQFQYPFESSRILLAGADIARDDNAGQRVKDRVDNLLEGYNSYKLYSHSGVAGGDEELTSSSFLNHLQQGYYLINHIDHSTDRALGAGVLSRDEVITSQQLSLINPPSPFFFVSFGCNTASNVPFSPANALMMNPNAAFGYAGFSTPSFNTELVSDSVFFWWLKQSYHIGESWRKTLTEASHDKYLLASFRILADPSFPLLSSSPLPLGLELTSYPDSREGVTPGYWHTEGRVVNHYGEPVPGAKVVVVNDSVYRLLNSDEQGRFELAMYLEPGELFISANKPGYIPYQESYTIQAESTAVISLLGYQVAEINGNEDTNWVAGESLRVIFQFHNSGLIPSHQDSMRLTTTSSTLTIIDSLAELESIPPGGILSVPVRINVSSEALPGITSFQISAYHGAVEENIILSIASPELFLYHTEKSFSYPVLPGDTIHFTCQIANSGEPTDSLTARIIPVNEQISPYDSTIYIGSLQESRTFSFDVEAQDTIGTENTTLFNLCLRDEYNRSYIFPMDISSPLPARYPSFESDSNFVSLRWYSSSSSDVLGYLIWRNDELITDSPLKGNSVTDTGLTPNSSYRYTLRAIDSSGNWSAPRNIEAHTTLASYPGFPIRTGEKIYSSTVVYDLNGNGRKEIIFADMSGGVYILNSAEFDERGILSPVFEAGEPIWASLAVGDVNNDGFGEIYGATRGETGKVFLLNYRGEVIWEYEMGERFLASVVMSDLDSDGYKELIAASESRRIYVWNWNGDPFIGGDSPLFAEAFMDDEKELYGSPLVEDIDGDGSGELVFVGGRSSETGKGHLYAVESDGESVEGFPVELDCWVPSSPVAGNLDSDSLTKEIVLLVGRRKLYAFSHNGEVLEGFPVTITRDRYDLSSPALWDIDNDGTDEIIVDQFSAIYIFSHDGTFYNSSVLKPYNTSSTPIIVDVDGDSRREIVTYDYQGKIYAFEFDGGLSVGFPVDAKGFIGTSPTAADIDMDGNAELLTGSYNNTLSCWRTSGTNDGWYTYRANFSRSGSVKRYVSLNVDRNEADSTEPIEAPYPSPFNSRVIIPAASREEKVEIYNVLGKLVYKAEGKERFVWEGRSLNHNSVPTGLYFYRLLPSGKSGKLHLVR